MCGILIWSRDFINKQYTRKEACNPVAVAGNWGIGKGRPVDDCVTQWKAGNRYHVPLLDEIPVDGQRRVSGDLPWLWFGGCTADVDADETVAGKLVLIFGPHRRSPNPMWIPGFPVLVLGAPVPLPAAVLFDSLD